MSSTADEPVPKIEVLLDYSDFPTAGAPGKKKQKGRFVMRSKVKKAKKSKSKTASKSAAKSSKSASKSKQKNKKKRGKKKKSNVEVTTMIEDVLEDVEDLDQAYNEIRKRVLAKFEEEGRLDQVSQCLRASNLEQRIEDIISSDCDTFYLVDITTVILKYKYFKEYMPRVQPFYAVKCNPDSFLISTLVACGAGLDVASMPEMQKGMDAKQTSDNMIFANPCKMPEHIRYAAKCGVSKMTFDNMEELGKIHKFYPNAQLVLRILADDSHSTMRFGSKFGANINTEARPLLEKAYELGLSVIGVSFHVGSGCQSGEAYRNSLKLARTVFDLAEELGHPMTFLDIGGGFLGTDTETVIFKDIALSISASLDELFPSPDIRIIAEPGRYFASECVVLVTTVIGRRERTHEDPETGEHVSLVDYYISDGVYGSFNNMFFDYYRPTPITMKQNTSNPSLATNTPANVPPANVPVETIAAAGVPAASPSTEAHRATLFGPTCDSIDVVCKDIEIPDLEIGDHVYFFNMGAYTSAAASSFNGFNPPKPYYMVC